MNFHRYFISSVVPTKIWFYINVHSLLIIIIILKTTDKFINLIVPTEISICWLSRCSNKLSNDFIDDHRAASTINCVDWSYRSNEWESDRLIRHVSMWYSFVGHFSLSVASPMKTSFSYRCDVIQGHLVRALRNPLLHKTAQTVP